MLKIEEVAARLGVSLLEARRLTVGTGAIPYRMVGPRGIRVEADALQKYIDSTDTGEHPNLTNPK